MQAITASSSQRHTRSFGVCVVCQLNKDEPFLAYDMENINLFKLRYPKLQCHATHQILYPLFQLRASRANLVYDAYLPSHFQGISSVQLRKIQFVCVTQSKQLVILQLANENKLATIFACSSQFKLITRSWWFWTRILFLAFFYSTRDNPHL